MEFSETESDPVLAKDRYVGNVILSVPSTDHIPLLTAAFVNIRDGAPQLLNRVRLTVDNEGDNTNSVIEKLSVFGRYIAYGSGSTLQSDKYVEGIKVAHSRFVPVTYVWGPPFGPWTRMTEFLLTSDVSIADVPTNSLNRFGI